MASKDEGVHGTGATRNRVVRISDAVWDRVRQRAEQDGVTLSDVVRRALVEHLDLDSQTGLAESERDFRSHFAKHKHENENDKE